MLTKREYKLSKSMIVIQVLISILCFFIVGNFFSTPVFTVFQQILIVTQVAIIWYILFCIFRLGVIFRTNVFAKMIRGYVVTVFLGACFLCVEMLILPVFYLNSDKYIYIIYFSILNLLSLIFFKIVFYFSMRFLRRKGFNSCHILLIADKTSLAFVNSFVAVKDWGYIIVAIVSPDKNLHSDSFQINHIEDYSHLKDFIYNHPVDDIFYCLTIDDKRIDLNQLLCDTREVGVSMHIMQEEYLNNILGNRVSKNHFDRSFVTHQTVSKHYFGIKTKYYFDLIFSMIILFLLSPLFLLIALLVKIEDGGPVFFSQERIGLNGRRFKCHKFRSMVVNAEALKQDLESENESDGPTFKMDNDPRITRIGRFLRRTSLDELPQFLNVVKSEMSIVGPRPPLLKEVQQYEPAQRRRLSMKPGITCTWQVWGRHTVSFKEWMIMDLEYIDKWSIRFDLKIILATIAVVFKANGR